MITTIIVLVLIILIIAYFIGASEEDKTTRKSRGSSNKKPTKSKQVFEVVKINNPQLELSKEGSIPDQKVESYSDDKNIYEVSVSEMTCTCPDFKKHRK